MRILLTEDEKNLARITKRGLEEAGYIVEVAHDGEEGLYIAENIPTDIIVLDIMLPKIDGLTILRRIRKKGVKTPVLLLTAMDDTSDKINGLDAGADDYLTKPFDFSELLARIRALLRRKSESKEALIQIAELKINTSSHEVERAGKAISLSSKEYAILEYLAYNKNSVISRAQLIDHVYNENFDCDSNIIDVYINFLRNKIDKGFKNNLIHTVRGAGYMLREGNG